MQEQRDSFRHRFTATTAVRVEVRSPLGVITTQAVDLSIGGIGLRAEDGLSERPDGLVELAIELDHDGELLIVPAEVAPLPRFDKTMFHCCFRPAADVHTQARIEQRLSSFLARAQRERLRAQPHLR
jgi:hypothetical protein